MLDVTGANASSLGAMLSTEVLKELAEVGNAKVNQKNGPARTLIELETIYGPAFNFFPIPGSKAKDHGSNILTDIGPWGEEGKQESWYKTFYRGSSQGKMLAQQIKQHADNEKTAENKADWEADKKALAMRENAAIQRIKDAVKLNIQLTKVNQLTEVIAQITRDESGAVIRSPACIFLRNESMTKFNQWSVGQFLQIDVDAAQDMPGGASWENVIKTTKKEPKSPEEKWPEVKKPIEYDIGLAKTLGYLVNLDEAGNEKQRNAFLAHLNEAGSDYLLLSMDQMYTKLENYLELPSIKKRLAALHEDGGLRELNRRRQENAA